MDLSNKSKLSISIIAILIVLLIILYICNNILNKNTPTSDCNCEVKKNEILVQKPYENIEKKIEKVDPDTNNKDRLCLYYADWCGYSRQFLPVWEKLKTAILSSNLKNEVVVAEFECDKDKEMCQKNREIIPGYPTVVLHKLDGKNIPYEGQREVEAIMKFIKKEI
jgi:hypothetical protein